MKVLLYSHAFHPSTGGVETVSMQLAEGFVRAGVECKVVTRTPRDPSAKFSFELIDNPGRPRVRELVDWADVVLYNGATLGLQPWVALSRKPFVWVHVGYQASCIDGAGWIDGAPAPRTPLASIRHHARRAGLRYALREGLRLGLRRFFATRLVTRHVAITQWMLKANPLPRQVQIYNPFPTGAFEAAASSLNDPHDFDFLYLGRLVSEKGVDVLLRAHAELLKDARERPPRLLVIGGGDRLPELEAMTRQLGSSEAVHFAGSLRGEALVQAVARGRIAVIPSTWAEPMGGVVVELMAAGRNLIVSREGGLAECVADAGLVFPNGDVQALAQRMRKLLDDPALQAAQSARARERALDFAPERFVAEYIALLRELTQASSFDSSRGSSPA